MYVNGGDSRIHHICVRYGSLLCNVINADVVVRTEEQFDDSFGPVSSITKQAKVTEWLFRAA